ncbi:hypothetical protein [Massilia sp. CCM 8734]|uniref:hypothetical protein n=1 Tax=Massilia sp. CCM 8734 TaxID=2609283 RepID=UPI00142457E8|nr:hypothetical protein [Massilia sp. CCM 8734]NHZ97838.1 hypothetical protein [Massilia sp. CCM 8734]
MKNISIAIVIFTIIALLAYRGSEVAPKVETVSAASTRLTSAFKPHQEYDESRVFRETCVKIPKLGKVSARSPEILSLKGESNHRVDYLLASAKSGSGAAATILFAGLRGCSRELSLLNISNFSPRKFSKVECASLPPEFIRNPLDVLIASAENGSNEARLLYIKNTPILAEIIRSSTGGSSAALEGMFANAERYGVYAVQSGSADAYAVMAFSHYSGSLGSVDLVRAYAYTLAAQAGGDPETTERLAFLFPQLTRDQYSQAVQLVGDCGVSGDQTDVLLSPFA